MRNLNFQDYFRKSMEDENLRRTYRQVLDEELAGLLRWLREEKGLSQKELAERLGVSRSRVSQMEASAGLSLTLEALARYAQALELGLRLEFVDGGGEVVARYTLDLDEPVAEPVRAGWDTASEVWTFSLASGRQFSSAA